MSTTSTTGPGDVVYYRLPHPLLEGNLLFFDAAETRRALDAARRGAPPSRHVYGPAAPPDEREVRAVEARFRKAQHGRARAAAGWSGFYWLLGPALALLWINVAPELPPLAALIASLEVFASGRLLLALVALAPIIWAWRRAWARAAEARRWGRLARIAGSRRFRTAPLVVESSPAVAAFVAAAEAPQARLRALASALVDKGADGAAEGAGLARALYRLAARHGLRPVAGAYYSVYAGLDAAEQRAGKIEHAGGGIMAERKAAGEMRRARRRVLAALAPFSPAGRARGNLLAPALGVLAGLAALAASFLLTGIYWVEPDQAVIIDPPAARLARAAGALGLGAAVPPADQETAEVERNPGVNWGWPFPFEARHAITLGEQRALVRAIFRQTGPDSFDGVAIEIRFRVNDVQRWAQIDRDGDGADLVAAQLSSIFQNGLQRVRQDARQAVAQQDPSLANDQQQLTARADQLVEARMDDLVRTFVGGLANTDVPRQAGIQVTNQYTFRLVHEIPGEVGRAALAGQ